MAVFKPFKALRPVARYASQVAALPYDVMNSEEARVMAEGKPYSFLHVDKAEIDLPAGTDLYSDAVYEKAAENLKRLETDGVCKSDAKPCFYIYRQIMNSRAQTGLVGCASVDDYIGNVIKKHELTRADKEADRIRHVDECDANTGPIFLCYRSEKVIHDAMESWQKQHAPVYDFTTDDGVEHTVWVIDDDALNASLCERFEKVDSFYIADGHHRAASAVKVAGKRREQKPDYDGTEEFNFFLAVLFESDCLAIMDYNRVIADLNGMSEAQFLQKISEKFEVERYAGEGQCRPEKAHSFGMLLGRSWYLITAKDGTYPQGDPVESLDVSILQNNLISPVLGIADPRTDKRIDFVGGIRGLGELEKRVNGGMALAFSMYPTTLDELMAIADARKVMPPKSTWFEPKLLSGLFIHKLK
ncbi:MAG: DUF1015 domain-containing protein [Clostridiales bacterium]|nr:DUF1015 domain-containing protein [Clostridiales bacterium]